jgi:hypothetical protein
MKTGLKLKFVIVCLVVILMFSVIFNWCSVEAVRLGNLDSDYINLGLTRGKIELWEDGMRMDCRRRDFSFELWYFDGTFDDGSSFSARFYSRVDRKSGKPFILLTVISPEGEAVQRSLWGSYGQSFFSSVRCDFCIGEDTVVSSDNGSTYIIKSQVEDIGVDLVLHRSVRSFRPDTGHILIGNDDREVMAWLSMVPRGPWKGRCLTGGRPIRSRERAITITAGEPRYGGTASQGAG